MKSALSLIIAISCWLSGDALALSAHEAAKQVEQAVHLKPDLANGREIYRTCAVCHEPEGWGSESGYYPQIAGQHRSVVIKQLADIRARNRDVPTMFPFAKLDILSLQDVADVAGYIEQLPMTRHNGLGPGRYAGYGGFLYKEYPD
jgi:cytochrome c553